jgi:hypothetical protein
MTPHFSLLWESRENKFIVFSRWKIFRVLKQMVIVVAPVFQRLRKERQLIALYGGFSGKFLLVTDNWVFNFFLRGRYVEWSGVHF